MMQPGLRQGGKKRRKTTSNLGVRLQMQFFAQWFLHSSWEFFFQGSAPLSTSAQGCHIFYFHLTESPYRYMKHAFSVATFRYMGCGPMHQNTKGATVLVL